MVPSKAKESSQLFQISRHMPIQYRLHFFFIHSHTLSKNSVPNNLSIATQMGILIVSHRTYVVEVVSIPSPSVVDVTTKKKCIPRYHQGKPRHIFLRDLEIPHS